jgi:hypothetical protein
MHLLRHAIFLGCATFALVSSARAVQLKVSRGAIERTLQKQLFSGPNGRYYLKGGPGAGCSVYASDPKITFTGDRILVEVKAHAGIGTSIRGACLGIILSPTSQVSVAPAGEGESIGFRDARVERISDQRELNFLLSPFLSHKVPSSMTVNAADLLRKALADSTATSGYKVALDRFRIRSVQIVGDNLVLDVDGDVSVQ